MPVSFHNWGLKLVYKHLQTSYNTNPSKQTWFGVEPNKLFLTERLWSSSVSVAGPEIQLPVYINALNYVLSRNSCCVLFDFVVGEALKNKEEKNIWATVTICVFSSEVSFVSDDVQNYTKKTKNWKLSHVSHFCFS